MESSCGVAGVQGIGCIDLEFQAKVLTSDVMLLTFPKCYQGLPFVQFFLSMLFCFFSRSEDTILEKNSLVILCRLQSLKRSSSQEARWLLSGMAVRSGAYLG
jgi:hypothetical protein